MRFQFRRWGPQQPPLLRVVDKLHMLGLISRLTMVFFKQLVTCHFLSLLPRLQDVEDREKENQAGFFSQQKMSSKNAYERSEGWDRRNKEGDDWYNRRPENPEGNKEFFDACDRSCVLNLQEPEDGEKAELTEHCNFKFLIPHDWCRYSSHNFQPGSSRTSINSRATIEGTALNTVCDGKLIEMF